MDMLLTLLAGHTLLVVFANVFAEELGVPIPAYPTMILAGGIVWMRGDSIALLLAVCVVAALFADVLWYALGQRLGPPIVRRLCRISLEPDSCVASTREQYRRWGPRSLLVAKFITGFATLATAMAGEARTPMRTFLLYDGLGALLWSGVAIAIGVVFHDALADVLARLESLGVIGLLLVVAALAAFLAWKWWQRRRFRQAIAMERIGVDELRALMGGPTPPAILDVRGDAARARDGTIPGAIPVSVDGRLPPLEAGEVVVFCACPNEASAALLAKRLQAAGLVRARPLAGGWDAWTAAGGDVAR